MDWVIYTHAELVEKKNAKNYIQKKKLMLRKF